MNKILQDLITVIKSIPTAQSSVPDMAVRNGKLIKVSSKMKNYERNYVAQLRSQYDNLIKYGIIKQYQNVDTNIEIIKKYIYSGNRDKIIFESYNKLSKRDEKKAFDEIMTIPDFFIHKEQDNIDEKFQKLVVEVKTASYITPTDFFLDLFKLNIYVEKYHFQNGVYLIVNNDLSCIKRLVADYKTQRFYIAPTRKERIYLFVKPDYYSEIETFKLIDN